jgi:Galactose-3-O-sulfotransferase
MLVSSVVQLWTRKQHRHHHHHHSSSIIPHRKPWCAAVWIRIVLVVGVTTLLPFRQWQWIVEKRRDVTASRRQQHQHSLSSPPPQQPLLDAAKQKVMHQVDVMDSDEMKLPPCIPINIMNNNRMVTENGADNNIVPKKKQDDNDKGPSPTKMQPYEKRNDTQEIQGRKEVHDTEHFGSSQSPIRTFNTSMSVVVPDTNHHLRGIVARPFDSWPNGTRLPCYPSHPQWKEMKIQFQPATRGFLYLKPYKTGSSTTSGVHLRIARNVAQRRIKQHIDICETRFNHGPDYHPGYTLFRNRIPAESFLWTVVRDPTQRAISQFFHFMVSRKKQEPSDENFKEFLQNTTYPIQDYYYHALYTKDKFSRDTHKPTSVANHILRNYNFIGITERMDESFVVLMMILKLKVADILHLSAKTKGGYDDAGGKSKTTCTYIWPSFVSPGMQEYFSSKEWRETVRYDTLLYEAVNRSLDMTIDQLGRERFQKKLQIFRSAQIIAQERCLPTTIFPCDAGGQFHKQNSTDCLWKDSGCGTTCLDEVATELKLW